MDPIALINAGISFGTVLALAGVVYAAGKHVRSLETIEEQRKTESSNLAKIPVLETRMTMVESSCASTLNETRQTREAVTELRAELRVREERRGGVVSALRPGRGPSDL